MSQTASTQASIRSKRLEPRKLGALIAALLLTMSFTAFLLYHFRAKPMTTAVADPLLAWEEAWTTWLASEPGNGMTVDGGPLAPRVQSTAVPVVVVQLFKSLNGLANDTSVLNTGDQYIIAFLSWAGRRLGPEPLSANQTRLAWENIPASLRRTEDQLEDASYCGLFSASTVFNVLEAYNRPRPSAALVYRARNEATSLLRSGHRALGLDLLRRIASYLDGTDPEFRAWLGSAMVMQAIDASTGLDKIRLVDEGMAVLDSAMKEGADNLSCHYIRAQTYLSLPEFYADQRSAGIAELAQITEWLEQNHRPTVTDTSLKQVGTAIDPTYLFSVCDFAANQPNLSETDRERISGLKLRVVKAAARLGIIL